jgi:stage III sporulation protein SpoIIIAA
MHAVVVMVRISDHEVAESHLREQIVPQVSQAPGFVAGYWARKDDSGMGMVMFESEDAAKAMSEMTRSMVPDVVTVENIEVREVVAHA